MENLITITQQEFNFLMQLYSAVLNWKSARLTVPMLKRQGEPEEKIAEAQQELLDCERALSSFASSNIGQRLFLASQGFNPDGDAEAV